MSSNYFVKLEQFEGPLDLLLHLIRVHELNIFQIDLFVLTSQYLDYLRLMNFRDLKDAAAFMEMAATLIEIKSSHLLPNEATGEGEDGELEEEEDPATTLQRRLFEYDTFRKAAEFLMEKPVGGGLVAGNSEWRRIAPFYEHLESPLRGDPSTLLVLYEQMLSSLAEKRPVTVKAVTESLTVEQVINKIKEYVEKLGFIMFQKLMPKMESRYELVANILAILQLVRDRELKLYQEEMHGPIWLYTKRLSEKDLPDEAFEGFANDQIGQTTTPTVEHEQAPNPL